MEIKITRTATPEPLTQFEREKLRDQLFQSGVLRWVEEKETYCNYFEEKGRIESDVDRKEMKKKVNNEQEIPQRIASKAVAPEVVNALKEAHEAAEKAVAAEEEAVPAIAVCAEQREKEIAKRMWACEPVSYDVVSIKKVEKEYDLDHAKAMWACEPVSYDVVSIKKVEKEYDIDHAKVSEMNGDMQAYLEAEPVKNEEGTVVESICCGSLFDEPKKAEKSRNASTQNDAYSETNDNKGASNLRTELLDNPRRVCTFDPGAQCKEERSALLMAESRATRDKWCVFINKSLGKDNDKDVEEAASSSGAFPNNGGSMKLVNDEIDLKKETRPSAFSHGFIVSRIPDDDGFDDGIDSRRDDPVYKDRMQVLSDISVIPSMDSCSVVGTIFRLDEDESDEEESLIFDPGGLLADSSYHGMTQENEDLTDDALFETDSEKNGSDYDHVDGMYQYHLCVATSDPEDSISCEYVNFDGIAQRIYVRHEETFEGTELTYHLECDEDIQGDMSPVRMGVLLPDFECSANLFVIRSFGDKRSLKEEKLTRNEEETIPRFTLKLEEWNETIDNVYELPQRDRQTILNYLRWTLEQETWEEEMAISRIRKEREEAALIDCGFEKASQVARDVAKVSGRTREPLVEETRDEFLDLDETCVDHADSDSHYDVRFDLNDYSTSSDAENAIEEEEMSFDSTEFRKEFDDLLQVVRGVAKTDSELLINGFCNTYNDSLDQEPDVQSLSEGLEEVTYQFVGFNVEEEDTDSGYEVAEDARIYEPGGKVYAMHELSCRIVDVLQMKHLHEPANNKEDNYTELWQALQDNYSDWIDAVSTTATHDDIQIYKEDVHKALVSEAKQYYKQKSRFWLDQQPRPEYLIQAEKCVQDEEGRLASYIDTQYKQYMAAKDVDLTQLRQYLRDNKIYTMHMKKDARFVTKLRQNSHEMRGYLRKESLYLKQVRLRYIVLSSHHLYSYKTDQCIELTESIDLNEYSHAEMSEHGPIGQFELISSKKQMKRRVFIGKSMAELDDWLNALRAVMKHKQNWYDKPHFGERFDYWSNDSSYPQYESMKEEMTSNKTHSLSVAAFECALNKAIYLHNCHKIRNMIPCRDVTDKYHLRYDAAPSVDHILAIVLWCDYRELSVALKRSFARISKAKYDELWIYSKYLIECVNAFGQRLKKSKHKSCYHLMECGHYMEYETMFNGAISTTTMPSVVLLKKQRDGVVLELTNYKKLRYFACPFVSYFGNENERLFISPPFVDKHCNYFAHIVSISDDICCYAQYIEPLNVLKQLLNNEVIDECMVMDGCKYLLSILLQQECVVAPPYVRNVLREWSDTVHHIRFNSYLNNKIVCDLDLYCQNIEYLVRFDKLNLMFKRLSTVHIDKNTIDIGNHDTMQYDWTCIASMLSMLDNINHNKHSQLKQIAIQCNDQMEITNWIQYKQLIADKKWSTLTNAQAEINAIHGLFEVAKQQTKKKDTIKIEKTPFVRLQELNMIKTIDTAPTKRLNYDAPEVIQTILSMNKVRADPQYEEWTEFYTMDAIFSVLHRRARQYHDTVLMVDIPPVQKSKKFDAILNEMKCEMNPVMTRAQRKALTAQELNPQTTEITNDQDTLSHGMRMPDVALKDGLYEEIKPHDEDEDIVRDTLRIALSSYQSTFKSIKMASNRTKIVHHEKIQLMNNAMMATTDNSRYEVFELERSIPPYLLGTSRLVWTFGSVVIIASIICLVFLYRKGREKWFMFEDGDHKEDLDIIEMERVMHLRGMMSYGSFLGDGSEGGVDYTTDVLHEMAVGMTKFYKKKVRASKKVTPHDWMAVESRVRTELRANAYDAANNHVVLIEGQVFAWQYLVDHYKKHNSKDLVLNMPTITSTELLRQWFISDEEEIGRNLASLSGIEDGFTLNTIEPLQITLGILQSLYCEATCGLNNLRIRIFSIYLIDCSWIDCYLHPKLFII